MRVILLFLSLWLNPEAYAQSGVVTSTTITTKTAPKAHPTETEVKPKSNTAPATAIVPATVPVTTLAPAPAPVAIPIPVPTPTPPTVRKDFKKGFILKEISNSQFENIINYINENGFRKLVESTLDKNELTNSINLKAYFKVCKDDDLSKHVLNELKYSFQLDSDKNEKINDQLHKVEQKTFYSDTWTIQEQKFCILENSSLAEASLNVIHGLTHLDNDFYNLYISPARFSNLNSFKSDFLLHQGGEIEALNSESIFLEIIKANELKKDVNSLIQIIADDDQPINNAFLLDSLQTHPIYTSMINRIESVFINMKHIHTLRIDSLINVLMISFSDIMPRYTILLNSSYESDMSKKYLYERSTQFKKAKNNDIAQVYNEKFIDEDLKNCEILEMREILSKKIDDILNAKSCLESELKIINE